MLLMARTIKGQTTIIDDIPVNTENYRAKVLMKGGLFHAIRTKMHWFKRGSGKREAGERLFVTQDGAPAHTANSNLNLFDQHGKMKGFDIQVITQPAQGPDFNWLGLSFFNSLQSDVEVQCMKTKEDVIDCVIKKFDEYSAERLEACTRCIYGSYRGCLACGGGNDYKTHQGLRNGLWEEGGEFYVDVGVVNSAERELERLKQELEQYDRQQEQGATGECDEAFLQWDVDGGSESELEDGVESGAEGK